MKIQQLKQIIKEEINKIINQPNWINSDSSKARIKTDVYYIGDNAEGDFRSLRGSAIPSYKLKGYSLKDIKIKGDGILYIKKGEKGWYDGNMFESENENNTVYISKEYIDLI